MNNPLSSCAGSFNHVQLFVTPGDCSPPGSSVHGILRAGILEWVALIYSRGIFPTQESNLRLLNWQTDSLPPCCCCWVTSVVSDSVQPYGLQPARLLCPWDSLGESIRVGCHAFFQGIFLTQGSNLGLLHWRWILYRWATKVKTRIFWKLPDSQGEEGSCFFFSI